MSDRSPHQLPRQNVLFFLCDDLGYGDLQSYGRVATITPNLDRFAAEGLRFTQFYSASPLCSPARAAYLTGRMPYRTDVFTWIPPNTGMHLSKSERTIPDILRQAGYATCHVGKWHLNSALTSIDEPQPNHFGFDWWMATENNARPSHRNPNNFVRNDEPVGNLVGYSADLIVDEAVSWLCRERASDQPFYLQVWTHEPHRPIASADRHLELYDEIPDDATQQFLANITQIDAAFGRLRAALEDMGEWDNTIVIFTSDHGPECFFADPGTVGSTGGLRGSKRSVYEGGIRVPFIMRMPEMINAGTDTDIVSIGWDLFPTVLDILGLTYDDRQIDGISLLPSLLGQPQAELSERELFWRWGENLGNDVEHYAFRIGRWKMVASHDLSRIELYDLDNDPLESRDLSAQERVRTNGLKARMLKFNENVEAEISNDEWREYQEDRADAIRAFLLNGADSRPDSYQ